MMLILNRGIQGINSMIKLKEKPFGQNFFKNGDRLLFWNKKGRVPILFIKRREKRESSLFEKSFVAPFLIAILTKARG